jgi:hypothetical protein
MFWDAGAPTLFSSLQLDGGGRKKFSTLLASLTLSCYSYPSQPKARQFPSITVAAIQQRLFVLSLFIFL